MTAAATTPGITPDRHEIHAVVTRAFHCANHIREGQVFVFDLNGRLDAARSDANLCLGILARLQPAILMAQDRLAEGLHPVSPKYRHFDCFDTGIDHGGTGKVYVELHLVDRATGTRIGPLAAV